MFATIITYPYQVIRTRLQNQRFEIKYNGVIDTIRKIYKYVNKIQIFYFFTVLILMTNFIHFLFVFDN